MTNNDGELEGLKVRLAALEKFVETLQNIHEA